MNNPDERSQTANIASNVQEMIYESNTPPNSPTRVLGRFPETDILICSAVDRIHRARLELFEIGEEVRTPTD